MRKAGQGADKELKKRLRGLGKTVLVAAKSNAPVGPRPKRSSTPPLAGSLRVSVSSVGVSIYSNAAHAYVQDRGGKVGRGAIIQRGNASGYMTKAVATNSARINQELERLLDEIAAEIHT